MAIPAAPPGPKPDNSRNKLNFDHWFENVFWVLWPKQIGKAKAKMLLSRCVKTLHQAETVIAGLHRWLKSERWAKEDGRFIPDAPNWVEGKAWMDNPPPAEQPTAKATPEAGQKPPTRPAARSAAPPPPPAAPKPIMVPEEMRELWETARYWLSGNVNKPSFEAHLRGLVPLLFVEAEGCCAVTIERPASKFVADYVRDHHIENLQKAFALALEREPETVMIRFVSVGGTAA